ncbi:hypothetical protein GCM10010168_57240 [Actinoplanes ianthinogenes]|uniref:DUF1707 domain-containing protein n=1 Tax=Actinoplanes ianthinogenes TaxID=122358 RepID=A0ABM7M2L0_9ACTN|nr:DUF1707 and DUF4190 domain-containing protein [Actinoplanes ianthinogenes]BCJ45856.1 hypothetical protein Aiant_65130 [Actinoplanes ianthinogenes]GGR31555.1 hypothetical protein GCM10010168_57240 [Actinoplanes ianthinogenes]
MYRSPHVRVSDADREAIVAHLSAAAAEGRLTIEEFSERSRQAYASRTWGELSTMVHDLPTPVPPRPAFPPPPAADQRSKTPLLAMIVGILSLPMVPVFGFPLGAFSGIAAVVLGVVALRANPVPNGRAMAITGLLCGSLGILSQVVLIVTLMLGYFS